MKRARLATWDEKTMTIDLVSLVLTLRAMPSPGRTHHDGQRWWGRAAQALLLGVVGAYDPSLAVELHEGDTSVEPEAVRAVRPYTVSSLMGHFSHGQILPGSAYYLRLTAFRADVAGLLLKAFQPGGPLCPGTLLDLDYLPFMVESVSAGDSFAPFGRTPAPWASQTTYQQLSAPFLLAQQPAPRRISLQLNSPTTFKSNGRHVPFPEASLVFGSLIVRWNAHAPIAFPAEVKRYADECLAISRYDLKTIPVPQKSGGMKVGAVGSVTFATLSYDRYWMSVLAVLAGFSLFCGLGAGTAQGLGQCCQIPETSFRQMEE